MPKTKAETGEKYVFVKLPGSLISEVDKVLGRHGYRSRSEFLKDAVRNLLREYPQIETPRFEHYNVYEDHVTLMDNGLNKLVDVYFRADVAFCELCQQTRCDHIRFVAELPTVMDTLKDHGWIVKDGKIVRR